MEYKQNLVFKSFLGSLVLATGAALAASSSGLMEKANEQYNRSDCAEAIETYQQARDMGGLKAEDRDIATFRIAYCAYNLGNTELGKTEFAAVLKKFPDEDEARIRYAELLFADEDFEGAIENANMVKAEEFKGDAKILIARSYIEIQDGVSAIKTIGAPDPKDPMHPVYEFWRGMAYFQLFNETGAERSFKKVLNVSPNDLWTKSAAENWLKTLEDAQQPVHVRLGATYGYDSNMGQMTYRDSITSSPNPDYYSHSSFTAYDLSLSSQTLHLGKFSLTPSISTYVQSYSTKGLESYNNVSYSGDLSANYAATYRWTLRGSLSYSDLSYNNVYYHNYLTGSFSAVYGMSKHSSVYVGLSSTKAIGNSPYTTQGPSAGLEGDNPYFYWFGNVALSTTAGEKAVYKTSSGTTSVASGTTFSSYMGNTAKVGIGKSIFFDFDLLGIVSLANTTYENELVPSTAAYSIAQRKDTTTTYQVNLSKTLIERRMTLTASYAKTKNVSSGFQGLSYTNGSSPDYNYTRDLTSLNLSYGF